MTGEGRLAGKAALVTGGSRGIGAEIVRRLASDGADVAFTYNTGKAEADEVAASVRGLGRRVLAIHADFADVTAPAAVAEAALAELGRLDILVNNAGVTFWRPVAQMDAASFDRVVAVDVRAPFLLMKEAAGTLSDGGRVINIASGVTSSVVPGSSLYSGARRSSTSSPGSRRSSSPPGGSRSTPSALAAPPPAPSRTFPPTAWPRWAPPPSSSVASAPRPTPPPSSPS
jgi:3-oxoacyl-[acyl-carrier protein] reductase